AKLDVSYDYSDLGWVAGRLGKYEDSLAAYRRVLALREEVARADPRDERAASSLATTHEKLGITLYYMGDLDASEHELRTSIASLDSLIAHGSGTWAMEAQLANVHHDLSEVFEARCTKTHGGKTCVDKVLVELAAARSLLVGLQQKNLLPKSD